MTPQVFYFTGEYANDVFTPETEGVVDDVYYYAPLTMLDRHGRRLMWGWIREGRTVDAQKAAGWAGLQAIPRQLSLRDGVLYSMSQSPHCSTSAASPPATPISSSATRRSRWRRPAGPSTSSVTLAPAGPIGLAVACAPDGSEQTRISYLSRTSNS